MSTAPRIKGTSPPIQLPAKLPPGVDRADAEAMFAVATATNPRDRIKQHDARRWLIQRGVFAEEVFYPNAKAVPRIAEPLAPARGDLRIVGQAPAPEAGKLDAESASLKGMIADNAQIAIVLAIAPPRTWSGEAQAWLAGQAAELHAAGLPVDRIQLADRAAADPRALKCGALAALNHALQSDAAASPEQLKSYAEMIARRAAARELESYGLEVARLARSGQVDSAASLLASRELGPMVEALGRPGWGVPQLDGLLPAAPFPLDVLPETLASLAREVSNLTCCPADLFILPCLTYVGSMIGTTAGLKLKSRWIEYPNLWTAYVSPRGNGKTPALEQAGRPLMRIFSESLEDHRIAMDNRERIKKAWEKERQDRGPRVPMPEALEEPADALARLVVNDTTWEGLGKILQRNPRGVAMYHDELAGWLNGMDQYKSGRGNDLQNWISSWSGAPVIVDRKGQDGEIPIVIRRPFVSVTGGIQPGKLYLLKGSAEVEDGFLDRLLFSYPDPVPQAWTDDSEASDHYEAYDQLIRRLWSRRVPFDFDGNPRPAIVRLSPGARSHWVDWFNAICQEFTAPDFPEHLRGAWSKFRIQCARLALILDTLRYAYDPEWDGTFRDVGRESVEGAIEMVGYFKVHFRRVFASILGKKHENPAATAILNWIARGQRRQFSGSDVKDNFRRGFAENEEALDEGIGWLVERNCIRRLPPPEKTRGRTPSPRYEVNPAVLGKRPPNTPESVTL